MQKFSQNLSTLVGSSAIAAAVTLALGWPSRVDAVGEEEGAQTTQAKVASDHAAPSNTALKNHESKVEALVVDARLATNESGQQVIRVECRNPTDAAIAGKVQLAVTRTTGSGMERVMPRPQIAWQRLENVTVAPGEALIREVPLPKAIGAEVARIERARKAAEQSETGRSPSVYFDVVAEALPSQAAKPKASSELVMRSWRRSRLPLANNVEFGY